MAKVMWQSFCFLSLVVITSVVVISWHLFNNGDRDPSVHRHVHLVHTDRLDRNSKRGNPPDLLFHWDVDKRSDYDAVMDFMEQGVAGHPQNQRGDIAARKLDLNSDSEPDSTDDENWTKNKLQVDNLPGEENVKKVNVSESLVPKEVGTSRLRADVAKLYNVTSTCKPLQSIAMIKTHKCSSSTLQNILFRKAEDLDLQVALPATSVYMGSPSYFSRRYIHLDRGQKYNIMASHMRFRSPRDVKQVMMDDAKYITILRDPVKQYESIFTYYGLQKRFKARLHDFLKSPERHFRLFEPRMTRVVGRNPMCYDNGWDARLFPEGNTRIDQFITILEEWYDLVLIAEYFDESLILLKDLMCWTLDDVVYFSQNARNKDSVVSLSSEDKVAIHKWNWADSKLYVHFNKSLWQKIEQYGKERMELEVNILTQKKEKLAADCIGQTVKEGDKRMWYPSGIKVNSFLLNPNAVHKHLCEQMTRPENTFLNKLREKQMMSFRRGRR
ncbi:Galactosylceramide sulfotransferase [Holothuria leucospilota]|uniref:Galactosylceramide sulfotransferase n=1 Tax=Holothuria leucospilota TaxID=206669 RepID=A0A9Q1BST9_HOLLE|nr:Galactosylceramide sulfotransferase [Holothuria leucospilota]